jgi:hypothetical protein
MGIVLPQMARDFLKHIPLKGDLSEDIHKELLMMHDNLVFCVHVVQYKEAFQRMKK